MTGMAATSRRAWFAWMDTQLRANGQSIESWQSAATDVAVV